MTRLSIPSLYLGHAPNNRSHTLWAPPTFVPRPYYLTIIFKTQPLWTCLMTIALLKNLSNLNNFQRNYKRNFSAYSSYITYCGFGWRSHLFALRHINKSRRGFRTSCIMVSWRSWIISLNIQVNKFFVTSKNEKSF